MSPLERLWKDRMVIYRCVETVVNEVTKNTEEILYSNIKCHYSKGSLTDTGVEGIPEIINSYTLFTSLETDLIEGDRVIVTQSNGKQVTLSVGEGFPYSNQMEFSVKRDDTV